MATTKNRHEAARHLTAAQQALQGQPGLSPADQIKRYLYAAACAGYAIQHLQTAAAKKIAALEDHAANRISDSELAAALSDIDALAEQLLGRSPAAEPENAEPESDGGWEQY